ncbi:hypothetical protein MRX96_001392 [Rhipicephalus microplus]
MLDQAGTTERSPEAPCFHPPPQTRRVRQPIPENLCPAYSRVRDDRQPVGHDPDLRHEAAAPKGEPNAVLTQPTNVLGTGEANEKKKSSDECVPVYVTELFPTSGCWTKQGRLNVLLKRPVFIHLHRLVAFGSQYRIRSSTVFDVL